MSTQHGELIRHLGQITTGSGSKEYDPKFPEWDGDRSHLILWLQEVVEIKTTKKVSEDQAKRYARIALGRAAHQIFDEDHFSRWSWEEFTSFLYKRFLPPDVQSKLMSELYQLKMQGEDYGAYFRQFQSYRRVLSGIGEPALLQAFTQGLEPYLRQVVKDADCKTLQEATDLAWNKHSEGPPPWLDYLKQMHQHTQNMLEAWAREAGQYINQQVARIQGGQPVMPPAAVPSAGMQLDAIRALPVPTLTLPPLSAATTTYGPLERPVSPRTAGSYTFGRTSPQRAGRSPPKSGPGALGEQGCYICGQMGHFKRDCPQTNKRMGTPPTRLRIGGQGQPGFSASSSSSRPATPPRESRGENRPPSPPGRMIPRQPGICDRCGGQGHLARQCPSRPRSPSPQFPNGVGRAQERAPSPTKPEK